MTSFIFKFSVFLYCAIILAFLLPQSSAFNSSNLHLNPILNYIIHFRGFNLFQIIEEIKPYLIFRDDWYMNNRYYEKRNEAFYPKDWEMFQVN